MKVNWQGRVRGRKIGKVRNSEVFDLVDADGNSGKGPGERKVEAREGVGDYVYARRDPASDQPDVVAG